VTLCADGGARAAEDSDAPQERGLAGWTRDEGAAQPQPHAAAPKADAQRIDWNDSFGGLGAGVASAQLGGRRASQQPNLTEFDHQRKSDKTPRR
jgi:hypothetical protein